MTKYLSRESILDVSDIQVEELEIPEWGGTVLVREMTTAEVEHFALKTQGAQGQLDTTKMAGVRAEVVAWCVVDEDGNALFKKSDVNELQKKSNRAIDKVFNKALELTGLQPPEESEAEPKKA